jgi:O-antigen ligase
MLAIAEFIAGIFLGPQKMTQYYLYIVQLFEGQRVLSRTENWRAGYMVNWYSSAFGLVRAIGTSFSPMAAAQILILTFFPVLSLLLSRNISFPRWKLISSGILIGIAIIVTISRGAWISSIIGGAIVLLFYLRFPSRLLLSKRVLMFMTFFGLLFVIIVYMLTPQDIKNEVINAFYSIIKPLSTETRQFLKSNEARFKTYEQGLDLFVQNPVTGFGFGNYAKAINGAEGSSSHNVFINLLVEIGTIGTILYILILFIVIRNYWLVIKLSRNPLIKAISVGWIASIISLIIYWNFTPYFYEPKLGMSVWLVFALSIILRNSIQWNRSASGYKSIAYQ